MSPGGRGGREVLQRLQSSGIGLEHLQPTGKHLADAVEVLRRAHPGAPLTLLVPVSAATSAKTIEAVASRLHAGDVVSFFGTPDARAVASAAESLAERGVHVADLTQLGRSGRWVAGGSEQALKKLEPALSALSSPGQPWMRLGNAGAASIARIAHDGAAQASSQAYAEGFSILQHKKALKLDIAQVAEQWRVGSVVRGKILDDDAQRLSDVPDARILGPTKHARDDATRAALEAVRLHLKLPAIDGAASTQALSGKKSGSPASAQTAPVSPVGLDAPRQRSPLRSFGMVGLGRMGGNMVHRVREQGRALPADQRLQPVVFARHADALDEFTQQGHAGTLSYKDLVEQVRARNPDGRAVLWMMVPHNAVDSTIEQLKPFLRKGDIVVDGGNSNFEQSQKHSAMLAESGVDFVDVGVSGGIWGRKEGYAMMVGGSKKAATYLRPLLELLAPAPDKGWGWNGPSGAGHFTKMVHNGIEYGTMEAISEAVELALTANEPGALAKDGLGIDARTLAQAFQGSDLDSWLVDLLVEGLNEHPTLEGYGTVVPDNGEGRWTAEEALKLRVPAPVLLASLNHRFDTQKEDHSARLLQLLRDKFGGHVGAGT